MRDPRTSNGHSRARHHDQAGSVALWRDGALGSSAPATPRVRTPSGCQAISPICWPPTACMVKDVELLRGRLRPRLLHRPARRHRHHPGAGARPRRQVVAVSALEALAQCGAAAARPGDLAGGVDGGVSRRSLRRAVSHDGARDADADAGALATLEEMAPPAVANPADARRRSAMAGRPARLRRRAAAGEPSSSATRVPSRVMR